MYSNRIIHLISFMQVGWSFHSYQIYHTFGLFWVTQIDVDRCTIIYSYTYSARLDSNESSVCVFWFFFFFFLQPHNMTKSTMNSAQMHCLRTHTFHFSATFLLKMGPIILFTHLKIILLQCFHFQFQFSVSTKISSIQTDP